MPEQLPVWNNPGIEPSTDLKVNGWQPGQKPSAQHFNWLFNRAYKCLEELQGDSSKITELEQTLTELEQTVTLNNEKFNEHLADIAVNVKDFGAIGDGFSDDTKAIQDAINFVSENGGGTVFLPKGVYNYTKLIPRSFVTIEGSGQGTTYLLCTDTSPHSSIIKEDDGKRVSYFGLKNLTIATAISNVSASQDVFKDVFGVNLIGCERSKISNVAIGGFGMGSLVLGRAEGGNEGFGFVNTVQDGNYNFIQNIFIASCGKYNPEKATIWLKYKANSNKFYGVFVKPAQSAIVISWGNDNLFVGGAVESAENVAIIGNDLGEGNANGNTFMGFRAESVSGDLYVLKESSQDNSIFTGYHSTIGGKEYQKNSTRNLIIGKNIFDFRTFIFPPTSSFSTWQNHGAMKVTTILGDEEYPLYIKPENTEKAPVMTLFDIKTSREAGDIIGRINFYTRDTSNEGVPASIRAKTLNSSAKAALVFEAGTANNKKDIIEVNDHLEVKEGTWNGTHLVMGTYHFWVDTSGKLRIKNGAPTSDSDGTVVGT